MIFDTMLKTITKGVAQMKLTLIGNGAMAKALALGLKDKYELEIVAKDSAKATKMIENIDAKLQIHDIKNFNIDNKTVILCVKPNALHDVAEKLTGRARAVISILAGTTLETIKDAIHSDMTVRAMPNIAAQFALSTTTIVGDEGFKDEAIQIMSAIGDTMWLSSEKELDIATAVAGSGPAYLALVAEAMMDGGVSQGLKRSDSIELVNSLFRGFAPLISATHPALIKDSVMSPAGTTAAGYTALEDGGVRSAFIKSIKEAYKVTQR